MFRSRPWLVVEFVLLFGVIPVAFVRDWMPLPLFPALWLLAAVCLVWLWRADGSSVSRLWSPGALRGRLAALLAPVALGVPLLLAATWWLAPERLFGFVRERPVLWVLVMLLYPLLSVLPQGVVYRAFVLRRYRPLLPTATARIAASALAFSFVHIIFENWIAPAFTLAGGVLFAWTHERWRSEAAAALQHALFGGALFTLGLGWYFYAGAVR